MSSLDDASVGPADVIVGMLLADVAMSAAGCTYDYTDHELGYMAVMLWVVEVRAVGKGAR